MMCMVQYGTDQVPGRVTDSERVFGSPSSGGDEAAEESPAAEESDYSDEEEEE
ncbi:MAG: hypothetical protein Q4F35_09035 [Akkermansia sp.]|nr:hypothetical protein [Akkermansia sp.]